MRDYTPRPMRSGIVALVLVCAALVCAIGCQRKAPSGKPVVAVSVPPQAWFVEQLADDHVQIETLLPPGASPHTYEPRIEQVAAVTRAAIYVEVGHPAFVIEKTWLPRFRADNPAMIVVDSSAGAAETKGDPHVWLSPRIVRTMVDNIARALAARLPADKAEIERRHAALTQTIDAVDRDVRQTLAGVKHKRFYVFHPAWGYFAAEYGLTQVSVEHEGHEPDARALQQVVAAARADHARAIFVQPQTSDAAARIVAREAGAKLVVIDPLARDWADNLRSVARALAQALS